MLGDLWLVGEGQGEMPGGGTGHDAAHASASIRRRAAIVGTWVGSMMHMLWTYDGFLDETGKVLTLESEGPSFSGDGSISKYRDIVSLQGEDAYRFSSAGAGRRRRLDRIHDRRLSPQGLIPRHRRLCRPRRNPTGRFR